MSKRVVRRSAAFATDHGTSIPGEPGFKEGEGAQVRMTDITDMVNKPTHYQTEAGFQAVDVVEQFKIPTHLDQAVIYILRHARKNGAEDIKKAIWWMVRWFKNTFGIIIVVDADGTVRESPQVVKR